MRMEAEFILASLFVSFCVVFPSKQLRACFCPPCVSETEKNGAGPCCEGCCRACGDEAQWSWPCDRAHDLLLFLFVCFLRGGDLFLMAPLIPCTPGESWRDHDSKLRF